MIASICATPAGIGLPVAATCIYVRFYTLDFLACKNALKMRSTYSELTAMRGGRANW